MLVAGPGSCRICYFYCKIPFPRLVTKMLSPQSQKLNSSFFSILIFYRSYLFIFSISLLHLRATFFLLLSLSHWFITDIPTIYISFECFSEYFRGFLTSSATDKRCCRLRAKPLERLRRRQGRHHRRRHARGLQVKPFLVFTIAH